jgi:plastocyanin
MKKIIIMSLLVVGVLSLSACSLYGRSKNVQTPTKENSAPALDEKKISETGVEVEIGLDKSASVSGTVKEQKAIESKIVRIKDFAFFPASLTIQTGAKVTWINEDFAPHQIKSATFNSSSLGNGKTFTFTFDTVGSFDYICSLHPAMTGKIIVE